LVIKLYHTFFDLSRGLLKLGDFHPHSFFFIGLCWRWQ
jgi:hypothetical protein